MNTCRQNYRPPTVKNNADVLNNFFANVDATFRDHLTAEHDVDIPNFAHSMFFFPTTKRHVEAIYQRYKMCRPLEMTSIPTTLKVITDLINRSVNEGLLPYSLKTAKIVLLFISGSNLEKKKLSPYFPTQFGAKFLRNDVFNRVYGYFEKLGILSRYQSDIIEKHSTIEALVELTSTRRTHRKNS